jgi:hypothetical protein
MRSRRFDNPSLPFGEAPNGAREARALPRIAVARTLTMRSAAQPIHDRNPETFFRNSFGDNTVEIGMIELAQLAK